MRIGIQKHFKMNNYVTISTWILFLGLSISCFQPTSAVSCWSNDKDDLEGKIRIIYSINIL